MAQPAAAMSRENLTDQQWQRFGLVCLKIRQLRRDGKLPKKEDRP